MITTREEHLKWCKMRALRYLDDGDLTNAVASMGSSLSRHAETHSLVDNPYLMLQGMQHAVSYDVPGVRKWIEGFQ